VNQILFKLFFLVACFNRNFTVDEFALVIRGSVITSAAGQVIYNMIKDGSVGNLLVNALEHSNTKVLPSGSTENSLSWNIGKESFEKSSIIVTSNVNRIAGVTKLSIGNNNNNQLMPQYKPFWILSSKLEYGSGLFRANVSEPISNSFLDGVGQYSFDGLSDWYVNYFVISL